MVEGIPYRMQCHSDRTTFQKSTGLVDVGIFAAIPTNYLNVCTYVHQLVVKAEFGVDGKCVFSETEHRIFTIVTQ